MEVLLELKEDVIIFHRIRDINFGAYFKNLNEENIIAAFSHEAIEYLICEVFGSILDCPDIHCIIGGDSEIFYKRKLTFKDYIGNTNGLPNLVFKESL